MSNPTGLTAREPALVASAAGAIVAYILGLLVTHGVLTATQASAVTQQVAPMVASLLVVGLGALIRTRVTPVVKAPPVAQSTPSGIEVLRIAAEGGGITRIPPITPPHVEAANAPPPVVPPTP